MSVSDELSGLDTEFRGKIFGGYYVGYTGKIVKVLYLAFHYADRKEIQVVYQDCTMEGEYAIWVAPAKWFLEEVRFADGSRYPRFKYLGKDFVLPQQVVRTKRRVE